MPKIMVWNIQELTSQKLNDERARQHIFENLYPSQEGIPTPDIFAVLEVVNDVAFWDRVENIKRGQLINQVISGVQPHNNQGMHTVLMLHELLQERDGDWCLVPPLSLADGTLSNRVIAVFYRKSKLTFCGPGIWTAEGTAMMSGVDEVLSEPAVLPENWLTGLQLNPEVPYMVNLPAYSQVNNDVNIDQRYLSSFVRFPEKMFPPTGDKQWARSPVLVCFRENNGGEYNPEGRLINLFVWHGRSKFDGGVSDNVLQKHTKSLAFIANEIYGRSEKGNITIVAGDFNTGTVDLTTGEPETAVFMKFLDNGFNRHFKQTLEFSDRFHPTAGPTTMVKPIAAITNILNPIEAEQLYPHLFMYITENKEQRRNPGYAIDNIFTKGISVNETSALIIERVAGNSYNDVMNVETNRYSYDMYKELPLLIEEIQGDSPAIAANAFYSSENYGGIRGGKAKPETWKNKGENIPIDTIRNNIASLKLKINQLLLEQHKNSEKLRALLEQKNKLLKELKEVNNEVSTSANKFFSLVKSYRNDEKTLINTILPDILSLTKRMKASLGSSFDLVRWQEFNEFQNIQIALITYKQERFFGGNFSSFNIYAHVETMKQTIEALLSYLPINDNLLELNREKKTILYGLQGLENDMAIAIEKLPDRVFEKMTKHGLEDEKFKEKLFNQSKQEIENRFSKEIERLRADLDAINLRLAEYREEFGDEIRNSEQLENQLEYQRDTLSDFIEIFLMILPLYNGLLKESKAQINLLSTVIQDHPQKFESSEKLTEFAEQVASITKKLDLLNESNHQTISNSEQIFSEMETIFKMWQQVTENLSILDLELNNQDIISNSEQSEELVNLNEQLTKHRYMYAKKQIDLLLKNITTPIIGVSDHMALVLDF